MRILILGDTHSYWPRVATDLRAAAVEYKIDAIVQVGDLCYLPKKYYSDDDKENDRVIIDLVEELDIPFYWIDGNHEDHSILQSVDDFNGSVFNTYGPKFVYQPRGSYIELGGYALFFVGGAESRDSYLRTEGVDFFREEVVNRAQADYVLEQARAVVRIGKPVIVIAHTCPFEALSDPRNLLDVMSLDTSSIPSGHAQGKFLDHVLHEVRPAMWFHGHYHRERIYTLDGYPTVFYSIGGYVQLKYDKKDRKFFVIDL